MNNNNNNYKTITYKLNNVINNTANVNDDHFNVLFKLFCYIILRYFI